MAANVQTQIDTLSLFKFVYFYCLFSLSTKLKLTSKTVIHKSLCANENLCSNKSLEV